MVTDLMMKMNIQSYIFVITLALLHVEGEMMDELGKVESNRTFQTHQEIVDFTLQMFQLVAKFGCDVKLLKSK